MRRWSRIPPGWRCSAPSVWPSLVEKPACGPRRNNSSRPAGSVRGTANSNNPFAGTITASLNRLTGQSLDDQKAYHDWWKDNRTHYKFRT